MEPPEPGFGGAVGLGPRPGCSCPARGDRPWEPGASRSLLAAAGSWEGRDGAGRRVWWEGPAPQTGGGRAGGSGWPDRLAGAAGVGDRAQARLGRAGRRTGPSTPVPEDSLLAQHPGSGAWCSEQGSGLTALPLGPPLQPRRLGLAALPAPHPAELAAAGRRAPSCPLLQEPHLGPPSPPRPPGHVDAFGCPRRPRVALATPTSSLPAVAAAPGLGTAACQLRPINLLEPLPGSLPPVFPLPKCPFCRHLLRTLQNPIQME